MLHGEKKSAVLGVYRTCLRSTGLDHEEMSTTQNVMCTCTLCSLKKHVKQMSSVIDSHEIVCTFYARDYSSLLDCRGFLKTIGVNSTEKSFLQAHVIKIVRNLVPVAL